MPLTFKEQKPLSKNNRKPLTNSTNTKDFIQRKSQKSHSKNDNIKSSQQKLINRSTLNMNRSTLNITAQSLHVQQRSHKKTSKEYLHNEKVKIKPIDQSRETFMKLNQSSFNKTEYEIKQNKEGNELLSGRDGTQSPSLKLKQSWGRLKQTTGKQVCFYDKYSKKDINISIIQEKSLLSNNQENSLDSLNNFIIEANNQNSNKSLLENSHQSSSFDEDDSRDEDWTLIQKEYEEVIEYSDSSQRQAEYLKVLGLMERENARYREQKVQRSDQLRQQFMMTMSMEIQKLNEEIKKLYELKNRKDIVMIESSSVERMIRDRIELTNTIKKDGNRDDRKHTMQGVDSIEEQKELGSILILSQHEKSLGLSLQRSAELKMNVQNLIGKTLNIKHRQKDKKMLEQLIQEEDHDRQQIVGGNHIEQGVKVSQDLDSQAQDQAQQQRQQQQQQQQQQQAIIQQSQFQSQSITYQDEKSQQEFIRYMDKQYLQKKQSEDNQANLSLGNISKIINIKPKQLNNKSIQTEHQLKEKDDDEVMAMLENQLRGKQQGKLRKRRDHIIIISSSKSNEPSNKTNKNKNNMNTLFLKQEQSLLQLKQQKEQQQEQRIQNQTILKDEQNGQIIEMKQAGDHLNEQNSLQPDQSQHQQNNKFFLALQAREKWIESLQKDAVWKRNQLQLIAKMKKILHNPYIEFQDY